MKHRRSIPAGLELDTGREGAFKLRQETQDIVVAWWNRDGIRVGGGADDLVGDLVV